MQQPTPTRSAVVVSLAERRAARRPARRRSLGRPLVALWFGVAILAAASILGFAATVVWREPLVGLPMALVFTTLASWRAAGSWLEERRRAASAPQHPARG